MEAQARGCKARWRARSPAPPPLAPPTGLGGEVRQHGRAQAVPRPPAAVGPVVGGDVVGVGEEGGPQAGAQRRGARCASSRARLGACSRAGAVDGPHPLAVPHVTSATLSCGKGMVLGVGRGRGTGAAAVIAHPPAPSCAPQHTSSHSPCPTATGNSSRGGLGGWRVAVAAAAAANTDAKRGGRCRRAARAAARRSKAGPGSSSKLRAVALKAAGPPPPADTPSAARAASAPRALCLAIGGGT